MKNAAGVAQVARLRVGREEREAVVDVLEEHYATERLHHDELTSRVHQALTATTRADLASSSRTCPEANASHANQSLAGSDRGA